MSRAVVFDGNFYRELTAESFKALVDLEQRRQVEPWADPWVLMELLAHLYDPNDSDHKICRHAVRLVYQRCAEEHRNGRPGGILKDSESQVYQLITRQPLTGHDEATAWLGDLARRVAMTPIDQPLAENDLRDVADHVAREENRFTEENRERRAFVESELAKLEKGERRLTRAEAIKELEKSRAMRTKLAEVLIRAVWRDAGRPDIGGLDPEVVEQVRNALAVGIEFYFIMLLKVLYTDAKLDASKTLNLQWDQRISYSIGQQVGANSRIWFVTRDKDFARAAGAAGYRKRVRSPDEYQAWLREKHHGLSRKR